MFTEVEGSALVTPDVSICIATYRRPRGLARLLESLARQKLPVGLAVEILVVDNDAEETARRSLPERLAQSTSIRWLSERRQNIAHARNRAVREARGRWIAFIDDDEVADENWLASFWKCVERDAGDAFFGPVIPEIETPLKSWLDPEIFYSRRRHPSGTLLQIAEVSTSNALVRSSYFEELQFDPDWGRTGGEDIELFERMLSGGASLRWCDEAIVVEFIPAHRYRLSWLTRRAFNGGIGYTRLARRRRGGARDAIRMARATLAWAGLIAILPCALIAGRCAATRVWLRSCTQAGHLWATTGRTYVEYGGAATDQLCE